MKPGEWIAEVQRKPWVLGARGPDAFDCYGLYYFVQRTFFGREVPKFGWANLPPGKPKEAGAVFAKYLGRWKPVEKPFEGCGVALSKFSRIIHHCGVWTEADKGLVVHSSRSTAGVVCQTLRELRQEGYKRIEFFEYCPEDAP